MSLNPAILWYLEQPAVIERTSFLLPWAQGVAGSNPVAPTNRFHPAVVVLTCQTFESRRWISLARAMRTFD